MPNKIVLWKLNATSFLGRNGTGKCIGVHVMKFEHLPNKDIALYPITSKGEDGRCMIQIPDNLRKEVALAICPELTKE